MASAADLSGRLVKFEVNSTPVEFEVVSCSVRSQGTVTHYCPSGTNTVDRSVPHHKLVTYSAQCVLITTNLPAAVLETLTQLTGVKVTIDRTAGSPKYHESTDAVVLNIEYMYDTSNHTMYNLEIAADGNYSQPV